jgi:outer membrane beta-barrel protein
MKWLLILFTITMSSTALAAKSLESELKDLDVKEAAPSNKLQERLYSVQMRATPLAGRWETLLGFAHNFSDSGFVQSQQFSLEGQYHFDDRWAVAAAYSHVSNELTSSAKTLAGTDGAYPDVDFARNRLEARLQANLFYGKFRMTRSQAMSFDQYLGLGVAEQDLQSGNVLGYVGDLGFAFWLGSQASIHLGAKDYYYSQNRALSKGYSHNVHGYVQAGFLF